MTHLLPASLAVRFPAVTIEREGVVLQLMTTTQATGCPRCAALSSSVHSRYQRLATAGLTPEPVIEPTRDVAHTTPSFAAGGSVPGGLTPSFLMVSNLTAFRIHPSAT